MAKYYKISGDTLKAIADHVRDMANTTKPLTLDEIIYWLGRTKFIKQGHAASSFSVSFESTAEITPDAEGSE